MLDLHRYLGGLSVAFVGLHLVALLADNFVQFSIADLLVPFATSYRTTAVAWGVLAFWLLVAVECSSLVMHRLPRKGWYGIHLTSYVIAVAATLHGLYVGTDTTNPTYRWIGLAALGLTGFFTIYRVLAPAEPRGRRSTGAKARTYS
jgi:predicted ferric reductase